MNRLYRDLPISVGLAAAVLIIGLALPGSVIWKVVAAISYIVCAWIFGERLAPKPAGREWIGLLALFATQSLVQTGIYYAGFHLDNNSDACSLAVAILLMMLAFGWIPSRTDEPIAPAKPDWKWVTPLLSFGLVLLCAVIYAAFRRATADSIRTPWPLLPNWTIAAIASLWLSGLIAALKARSRTTVAILSAGALFSVVSIAPSVYILGFGFDGFLHRASEQLILQTGTLNPKPAYYIGQYVFTTWSSRMTGLDLASIDRWLVPFAFSLIPFFLLLSKKNLFSLPSFLLLVPLAPFIASTPQSFAYVIGLIGILIALSEETHPLAWSVFSLWSIAIHPLAGLPFAAIACALVLLRYQQRLLAAACVLIAAISVPSAFLLLGSFSSTAITWDWSRLVDKTLLPQMWQALSPPQNRVAFWEDWSSLIAFLILPSSYILASIAAVKDKSQRSAWMALLTASVLLMIAGFVLKAAGDFPFLIDYERGNYADRLFVIAALMIAVPASAGPGWLFSRLTRLALLPSVFCLLAGYAWFGAQAYNALPRHDAAIASHGWSVGLSDIEAVHWIDQDAGTEPYTVLANQSVSAAAVQELGFKRYEGDIFFYPIPTGGPLYQDFLDAVAPDPSLEAIKNAAKLGHSKRVYVVLNEYWWDVENVAGKLSSMADDEHDFGNGVVRVYTFNVQ